MANAIVNRQVNIYISSGEAQKALDKLIAKEKLLKDELAKATDPRRIAALNAELKKLAEPIDRATKKLKGELAPSFRELQSAAARAIAEFKHTGDPEMLAQYHKFNEALQQQKNLINGIDNAQQGLTKKGIFSAAFWANLAAGGIQAAASALSGFFRDSFGEALEAEQATSRLKNTLENLGRTDVFERMINKAQEMANRFKFLDNDDVVGVFKKLIDFGKLTEKEMNDLLPVIIDFASNARISLEESTDVIVKALEGNGKALKTYGIDIKDAGTETERLNVIMTTLKDKVDGAAEAFGNSAAGGIATARQEFNNLKEELGNGLLPLLNKTLEILVGIGKGAKIFAQNIKDLFSGNALGTTTGIDNNIQSAIENSRKFFESIKDKTQKERIVEINLELQANEKQLKLAKDWQIIREDGEVHFVENEKEQKENLAYLNKRNALIKDGLALEMAPEVKIGIQQTGDTAEQKAERERKAKEAAAARKKAIEEYRAFLKRINELNEEFDINQQEGFEKDLAQLQKKIANLNEEAAKFKDNKDLLLRIEELYRKESLALIDKYTKLDKEKFDAAAKEKVKALAASYQKLFEELTVIANTTTRDKAAKDERAILNAKGDEKIKLQKAQIQKEADAEVEEEITKLTKLGATRENAEIMLQNVIALIRQKAREKEEELELQHVTEKIDSILGDAQQALQILDMFFSAANAKENAQLQRDRKVNDQKKANFKRQLDGKVVTQLEYNRQIAKLDKEQDKREYEAYLKKFKRDKTSAIIQANINGALGITKTGATLGYPAAIPFIIAQGIVVAAQLIAIASEKPAPPASYAKGGKFEKETIYDNTSSTKENTYTRIGRFIKEKIFARGGTFTNENNNEHKETHIEKEVFAKGGKLGGRSHAGGGNPILDGSGRKIAEIEQGEVIINKKTIADKKEYTVTGTPSQIASSINRLHGGVHWESGAVVIPEWRTAKPPRMNFPVMKQAFHASGGVFQQSATTNNSQQSTVNNSQVADNNEMKQLLLMNTQAIIELREQMKKPQKNYVKITDVEDAQDRLNTIRSEATIKG